MATRSEELFAQACELIPGGVNSPVRACHNVQSEPLFIARGKGSHLTDMDGKDYVDFVLGAHDSGPCRAHSYPRSAGRSHPWHKLRRSLRG